MKYFTFRRCDPSRKHLSIFRAISHYLTVVKYNWLIREGKRASLELRARATRVKGIRRVDDRVCIRNTHDRWSRACCNRKMSSSAITSGSNVNLSARQAQCRTLQRCTWMHVALYKRDASRRHGAFRRGAAVSRAQVELVSVRRTRLLLLERARWKVMHLETNGGWIDANADRAEGTRRREKETKRRMEPGHTLSDRYFHS